MLPRLAGAGSPNKCTAARRAGSARGRRPQHSRYAGTEVFFRQAPQHPVFLLNRARLGVNVSGSLAWCIRECPRYKHLCSASVPQTNHQPVTRCQPAVQRTPRTTATLSATRSWRRSWTGAPTAHGCPASWAPPAAWWTSTGMPTILGNLATMDAAGPLQVVGSDRACIAKPFQLRGSGSLSSAYRHGNDEEKNAIAGHGCKSRSFAEDRVSHGKQTK